MRVHALHHLAEGGLLAAVIDEHADAAAVLAGILEQFDNAAKDTPDTAMRALYMLVEHIRDLTDGISAAAHAHTVQAAALPDDSVDGDDPDDDCWSDYDTDAEFRECWLVPTLAAIRERTPGVDYGEHAAPTLKTS